MSSKKALIADYFKHRFWQKYDVEGNDLSALALQKLKGTLSEAEFVLYQRLEAATNEIVKLISEDEERDGTPADEKIIKSYEHMADDKSLPREVRKEMYELVLTGREKFIQGDSAYLRTLEKKLALLNKNNVSDLKYAVMQIKQHSSGVSYSLKRKLLLVVRKKLSDNDYPDKKEAAELKKMSAEEKRQHRLKLARQKMAKIDTCLKGNISPDEKFELLQQKFETIGNCGLGRMKSCHAKIAVCEELEILANIINNVEAADFYAREQEYQSNLIANIVKYSRLRANGK